jgi:hypothetical protein
MKFFRRKHPVQENESEKVTDQSSADFTSVRYCCGDVVSVPFGIGNHLFFNKAKGQARLLGPEMADLLNRCRTLRTLDEHAAEYRNALSFGKQKTDHLWVESVKEQLAELVEAGLLISDEEILKLCQSPAATTPGVIASIGIVTRDRPESLSRCLTSYIQNCGAFGRKNDYVVMDDSQDAASVEQLRQMLHWIGQKYQVSVAYAGCDEKQRFADALLAETDVPPEVIRFALFDPENCGISTGANRNALLLHTSGDLFLSVDDDTECRLAASSAYQSGLTLDSGDGAMEYRFFPDRDSLLSTVTPAEKDFPGIHEQLLGKGIAQCLADFGEPEIGVISPQFLRGLRTGNARVAVTLSGVAGDSGVVTPLPYLMLKGESRERLVRSESEYQSAFMSREVFRVIKRTTITEGLWNFQTGSIGYDNRSLLPPFFPVQRGQDGLFGVILRQCFGSSYIGHLPWAIFHNPEKTRTYRTDEFWQQATRIPMIGAIIACVHASSLPSGLADGRDKIHALGKYLIDLGSLKLEEFEELVRINLWNFKSSFVSAAEHQLRIHRASPDYWASDLSEVLDRLFEAIVKSDYVIPCDILEGRSRDEARHLLQHLVYKFGQLLYWWPEIVDGAGALRSKGQRLAVPV